MMTFKCSNCSNMFQDCGIKNEYFSPINGPCFKYVAKCPVCNTESDEYRSPTPKKAEKSVSSGHSCNGCCCN